MSFTRLLATSRSIMGIKKQPGPYLMNEDHLLPKFGVAQGKSQDAEPSEVAEVGSTRSGGPPPIDTSAVAILNSGPGESKSALKNRVRSRGAGGEGFWKRFLARIGTVGRWRPGSTSHRKANGWHVQGELSLEGLRVVRNDLSDSDFEVVRARKRPGSGGRENGVGRQPLGMVWNRLSARLLRQAVQDFNLVQKERGKLLSQAGNGRGSADRP
jgi:hypothetical protein